MAIFMQGIPYSQPLIGSRRFSLPIPPNSWTGVRDATFPRFISDRLSYWTNLIIQSCLPAKCIVYHTSTEIYGWRLLILEYLHEWSVFRGWTHVFILGKHSFFSRTLNVLLCFTSMAVISPKALQFSIPTHLSLITMLLKVNMDSILLKLELERFPMLYSQCRQSDLEYSGLYFFRLRCLQIYSHMVWNCDELIIEDHFI